jgi:hypothetical protein
MTELLVSVGTDVGADVKELKDPPEAWQDGANAGKLEVDEY